MAFSHSERTNKLFSFLSTVWLPFNVILICFSTSSHLGTEKQIQVRFSCYNWQEFCSSEVALFVCIDPLWFYDSS